MTDSQGLIANVKRLGLEVAGYFTYNPRIQLLGFAGLGRHGGTIILSEAASDEHEARNLVVKYSYGALSPDEQSNADEDLRNEYRWLKRLRGAEHIVQLIPMADCSLNIPGTSNGDGTYQQSQEAGADGSQPSTASNRRCPTFALEYLPYDTIFKLDKRIKRGGEIHIIPSRFLWRLWLCMIRQCIAMAFPPNLGEEEYYGQIIREEIQNKPYEGLTQNSAHNKNFMFGEAYLGGLEHEPGMPVLKLIDFGRGKIETEETSIERLPNNPTQYGSSKNLSGAAQVLMRLACVGPEIAFPQMNRVIMYNYTDEFGIERSVQTRAPAILRQNTIMDPQLRHMLVRCLAYPHAFRPTLQEVLDETVAAVRDRGPTYPGLLTEDARRGGVSETDDAIRDFLQRFIYDPPPPPGR